MRCVEYNREHEQCYIVTLLFSVQVSLHDGELKSSLERHTKVYVKSLVLEPGILLELLIQLLVLVSFNFTS